MCFNFSYLCDWLHIAIKEDLRKWICHEEGFEKEGGL